MLKYIKVDWPDTQKFQENLRYFECYFATNIDGQDDSYSSLMVPEDLYEEVMYKLQFPKKYENTNLGTIVCYETRAVVNGNETFYYDLSDIRKGDKVLIYNKEEDKWIITNCQSAVQGFPILLEEKELLDGINCEIIGHYDPEIPF